VRGWQRSLARGDAVAEREVVARLLEVDLSRQPGGDEEDGEQGLEWTPDAEVRILRVPPFALGIARKAVEERTPDQSQQETLGMLGDDRVRELVERYVEAWEQDDVDTVMEMLADDATFAMPPLASWFGGEESIRIFLEGWPMSGAWRWRPLQVRANGQPALAFYTWDEGQEAYLPFALNVLTFRGELISDVTAFVARATDIPDGESYARWPDEAIDPMQRAWPSSQRQTGSGVPQ